MKNVDWSKAPEGATHFNSADYYYPWLKETPASFFDEENEVWVKYYDNWHAEELQELFEDAVKRPQEPQEWDGCGVPPVGTVCEVKGYQEVFYCEVEIIAYNNDQSKFWYCADGVNGIHETNNTKFRPIKTPEQIAAEERSCAIDEMIDLAGQSSIFKDAMAKLYDAGYRKKE